LAGKVIVKGGAPASGEQQDARASTMTCPALGALAVSAGRHSLGARPLVR